jgi:hypothetical protein
MIDLESTEWKAAKASPGGNGALTADLLRQFREGDDSAFGELYQQVCHQGTVGEVAYLAVPHMVVIARNSPPHRRALLLGIVGSIVASMNCYPRSAAPLPDWLRAEFLASCEEARILAGESLREGGLAADDSFQLIGALAAFHGHHELSLLMDSGRQMSCPSCGERIEFGERRG